MPKTVFDYTEMKSTIDRYLKELADLNITGEEAEKYGEFCYSLTWLRGLTEHYYTPQPDGTYPPLKDRDRLELIQAYYQTLNIMRPILQSQEDTPVATAIRSIAVQLTTPLLRDVRGLEVVDLSKQEMTLPELIARGRMTAVDLGKQKAGQVGANSNSRMYLSLEDGEGIQKGYFTANRTVAPRAKFLSLLTELEKKYPSMGNLIGSLKKVPMTYLGKITIFDWNYMSGVVTEPRDQWKEKYDEELQAGFYNYLGVSEEDFEAIQQIPEFYRFNQEFIKGMKPIVTEYANYRSDGSIDVPEGANLDRRNLAVYRMAGLLGKQHMVPETKLLTVVEDGKVIAGTFMAEAQGLDINKAGLDHPVMKAKAEAFENPSVVSDIAGMQVLDYICGNVDRHPGNFLLRFEPAEGDEMKLVGISLIDNDLSFGRDDATGRNKGNTFVRPEHMGVVGQETYNAMRLMTREQMELMLADCRLSKEELDAAWIRKENLQKAIEADLEYFRDKEVGFVEKGRIRLVPEEDWDKYSIHTLAQVHEKSQFDTVVNIGKGINFANGRKEEEREIERRTKEFREMVGLSQPPEEIPVTEPTFAKAVGTGLEQAPDPKAKGKETLNLALPSLAQTKTVGDNLSKRYVLTYLEDGQEKTVFFTPPQISSIRTGYDNIFEDVAVSHPRFRDELMMIRDYYRADSFENLNIPSELGLVDGEKVGFSKEQFDKLKEDPEFREAYESVARLISKDVMRMVMLSGYGQDLGENRRMELRNVAMSEVGDLLGTGDLLCRSRTANVMCDGKLTEGVVMDLARGEDPSAATYDPDHPMKSITSQQAGECYNQPEALKQMADMQILDFVCLNVDRHQRNLFYQYEGLGTDHPKLVGIQGIDNDGSFGKIVPKYGQEVNKLPALEHMKVISREMWEKIQDPQLPDKVGQVVLNRGMSVAEAIAAKSRIQMVKDAVQKGTLRIVERDQWAKDNNTFEELSAGEGHNLFHTIRTTIVEPYSKIADEKVAKVTLAPIRPKAPLKGTQCVKVDQIGGLATEQAALEDLEKMAEDSWRTVISNRVIKAENIYVQSYASYVKDLRTAVLALKEQIDEANPLFSFTSKTYKNMSKACNEVVKETERAILHLEQNGGEYDPREAAILQEKMNRLRDTSAAYTQKKEDEIRQGGNVKPIGYRRKDISGQVSTVVKLQMDDLREIGIRERTKLSPFRETQERLKEAQGSLSTLTGDALKDKVAEILYLKSLTTVDMATRDHEKFQQSLLSAHIEKQKDSIRKSKEFDVFRKMPDRQLRALAAGKGAAALMKTFLEKIVKDKTQAVPEKKMVQKQKTGKQVDQKVPDPKGPQPGPNQQAGGPAPTS